MNLNLLGVVMVTGGLVLVRAAIINKDPRDLIRETLFKQPATHGPLQAIDPMDQSGNSPTPRAPAEGRGQPESRMPVTWVSV